MKETNQIQDDLKISGTKWDMSLYNSDMNIENSYPLYIITSEGFIIERSNPIHGLLDLSRFSFFSQYTSPATVEMITGEKWRVLSTPVISGEQQVGIIFASIYEPNQKSFEETDIQLDDVLKRLKQNITASGDVIDITKIDPRYFPYNVSFQIVSRFNKVLYQSNNVNSVTRMPTFIDRSYIESQLKDPPEKLIRDDITNERYLTLTTPIINEKGLVSGIVVIGASLEYIYTTLKNFIVISTIISLLFSVMLVPFIMYLNKRIQSWDKINAEIKTVPKIIKFLKKDCQLLIDDQKIDIPYSSYQYYFLDALFQKPQKKWEVDELLDFFGEEFTPEKWRKVYDTMVALNKKTGHKIEKLFIVKNKRYSINSGLISLVKNS